MAMPCAGALRALGKIAAGWMAGCLGGVGVDQPILVQLESRLGVQGLQV